MGASRNAILAALGDAASPGDAPPTWCGPTVRFPDPLAAFREALEAAGGFLGVFSESRALERALAEAGDAAVVLRGGPAVAECGAVWWAPADPEERRTAFLAERVLMVVPRAALVGDLHAAYARIDPAAAPYGCFVSGPSKTADIEQALVIGAHGPRSLHVFLVG